MLSSRTTNFDTLWLAWTYFVVCKLNKAEAERAYTIERISFFFGVNHRKNISCSWTGGHQATQLKGTRFIPQQQKRYTVGSSPSRPQLAFQVAVWIGPSVLTGGVFALHSPGPYPLVRYPNIAALLGCHAHRLLVLQVRRPRSCGQWQCRITKKLPKKL